jgi:phosphatidylethanolamine/phosphatidyl-N-methylethanolamine N-methyltransferase
MSEPSGPISAIEESLLFLARFVRSPRSVGAIAPSSRYLARRMIEGLEVGAGGRVIEFGPGTGAFTGAIARRLPAGARYLGIERDPVFVAALERRWPSLEFACDSVENLLSIAEARSALPLDHIVSGLPFARLPRTVTLPVLDAAHRSLRPGGTFTTFQYIHAYPLPAARAFRREMQRRFGPPFARRAVVRNLPPAFVLAWRKER